MRRRLLLLGVLLVASLGCSGTCGHGTATSNHVDHLSCAGTLSAPASLGLPTTLPSACTGDTGGCIPQPSCLMSPSTCASTCLQLDLFGPTNHSQSMRVVLMLNDPQHSQSLTLPSPKVTVSARYFDATTGLAGSTLTAGDGTFSATLAQGHLHATFALQMSNAGGDQISIGNATYDVTDEVVTSCLAN